MKTINAYLYPTPEEFELARRTARYQRIFNPEDHLSIDEHDPVEHIIRDNFAKILGLPPNFFEVDLNQVEPRVLKYLHGGTTTGRFIPNAPDEFVWRSHDGKRYNVSDMATPHLFYSLRMIFNHTVPPVFRILRPGETMKRYPDVSYWADEYRKRAVDALAAELEQRDDLDEDLAHQFADMQANTRVILALGL